MRDGSRPLKAKRPVLRTGRCVYGGARRDRTDDLLHAMQSLSQLSYGPEFLGMFPTAGGRLAESGRNLVKAHP